MAGERSVSSTGGEVRLKATSMNASERIPARTPSANVATTVIRYATPYPARNSPEVVVSVNHVRVGPSLTWPGRGSRICWYVTV